MTPAEAKKLREPFPPELIGKLPKAGIQLDYVGHAAVTDRLLAVDPFWTWEPMGFTAEGTPALDRAGNLWIRLTVLGVTRPGVGDGKTAKECIGDAIRNAAMRFGVALDLWAKEDLHTKETAVESSVDSGSGGQDVAAASGTAAAASVPPEPSPERLAEFIKLAEAWAAIAPDFNLGDAVKEAKRHDDAWLTVAAKKLQGYIDDALGSAEGQSAVGAAA